MTSAIALHNPVLFFSFVCIAHQSLSTGGLERLIYDVNRAVKGKANRKEHAQHQRRTLSCCYISLFLAPSPPSLSICPVTTLGPPEVYKDTGLSPSIIADILKRSFTSDQAVSRHTVLTPLNIIFPEVPQKPQEKVPLNITQHITK